MPERRAAVVWNGNLIAGQGTITETGSGALGNLPITWSARTETSDGKTSPEELLAAANAACFAMAFASNLAKAGHPPEHLAVSAVCSFDKKPEGGWKVATMHLDVQGRVPGIDPAEFTRLADDTGQNCPISSALRNNVAIAVQARLES
ncbi:MAG TPA: OsmC family peroxiredoxin [Chloroflexia bacterium]|nr:OsmC family peroxiredoxin [Chloroflexia bacterium]